MEDISRGYQRLQEMLKDKDTEIEHLKREKQEHLSEIRELNAKLISIQKLAVPTRSSSSEKKEPPTISFVKLPTRPSSLEKKQRPISVFADLPAPPVFKGFDIALPTRQPSPAEKQQPISISADLLARPISTGFGIPWTKPVAPPPSPQMFPPRPPPFHGDTKFATESNILPTLPTRSFKRPEGTVPPLQPYRYSFGAIQTEMLDSTPEPLPQDATRLFTFRSPHRIQQQSDEAPSQESVDGSKNQSSDDKKSNNEGPVVQQTHGH